MYGNKRWYESNALKILDKTNLGKVGSNSFIVIR